MAFIDFLYGTTPLILGIIVCAITVGSTIIALFVVDRTWNRELRKDHNDIAGFLIAVVGVIFAILVSSLTLEVLTRQDRAKTLVVSEAQSLEAIDHDIDFLKPSDQASVRAHTLAYLEDVIDGDWRQMRDAVWPSAADTSWEALWKQIGELPVGTNKEMMTAQSLRQELDKLAEIRRERSEIATRGVDPVIWSVVLLGSLSTILFAVIFGVRNFVAHLLMTSMLSFTIALAITMIIAIDWPYYGGDSVGPGRLVELRASLVDAKSR